MKRKLLYRVAPALVLAATSLPSVAAPGGVPFTLTTPAIAPPGPAPGPAPVPAPSMPLALPSAAPTPPLPLQSAPVTQAPPAVVSSCNLGLCFDTGGNLYSGGGSGRFYLNNSGRTCTRTGMWMQCN
jgi:hypothetical protein